MLAEERLKLVLLSDEELFGSKFDVREVGDLFSSLVEQAIAVVQADVELPVERAGDETQKILQEDVPGLATGQAVVLEQLFQLLLMPAAMQFQQLFVQSALRAYVEPFVVSLPRVVFLFSD